MGRNPRFSVLGPEIYMAIGGTVGASGDGAGRGADDDADAGTDGVAGDSDYGGDAGDGRGTQGLGWRLAERGSWARLARVVG